MLKRRSDVIMLGMVSSVITRDTKKEEWGELRGRIKSRILESFGKSAVELAPAKNKYEVLDRYVAHGLQHVKIRYEVLCGEWSFGVLVLPENFSEDKRYKAVLTVHGTNGVKGKYGVCDPENQPKRAYAIELARRGFVTLSPDQYGFGEAMEDGEYRKGFESFYDRYPEWSLSSRRVLGHIRALDVLDQLDFVEHTGYGVIGNSLGGQASFYITAFDERIKASVISTGISPNATNVYRDLTRTQPLEPGVKEIMKKRGRAPWELNEMLALCAPRAVLCLEPFDDPYNPYTSVTIDCIKSAWEVYKLMEAPEKLTMYIHGDGHDTVDTVRDLSYDWLERFL